MVTNAGLNPIFRPRFGHSGGAPLAERFEQTKAIAKKEIPIGDPEYSCINLMVSEQSIDAINDAIARSKARRAKPVTEELRAAWAEFSNLRRSYNNFVQRITEMQKRWLPRAQSDWRHKLLRSIKQDHFWELKPLPGWEPKDYPDTVTTRKASKELFSKVQWAEEICTQLSNSASFDSCEPAMQHLHLIHALADDKIELENRVTALEAQVGALEALVNKYKRK
jgi:hypothetical protein